MQICVYLVQVAHGKSFFTKLQILRYRLLGINQYVIDPEREYTNLAKNVDGVVLKLGPTANTYINILALVIALLYSFISNKEFISKEIW